MSCEKLFHATNQPKTADGEEEEEDITVSLKLLQQLRLLVYFPPTCNYIYKQINVKNLNRTSSTELC